MIFLYLIPAAVLALIAWRVLNHIWTERERRDRVRRIAERLDRQKDQSPERVNAAGP